MAMATSVTEQGFEDRFVVTLNENPTNTNVLMKMAWSGRTPLKEVFAIAPPDSVMVGNNYMEGEPLLKWALDYAKGITEMQAAVAPGQEVPKIDEWIAKAETEAGLKLADLASAIKGNAVYWTRLAETLAPPELGAAITCTDEAAASQLAANLTKAFNAACKIATGKPAPAIEKMVKDGRTLFTESADKIGRASCRERV